MTGPRKSPVDVVIVAVPETAGSALYGMASDSDERPFLAVSNRSHLVQYWPTLEIRVQA
jgi:hypothetical protein